MMHGRKNIKLHKEEMLASEEGLRSVKLFCWSVGQSVGQLVGQLVSQSVGQSVGQLVLSQRSCC